MAAFTTELELHEHWAEVHPWERPTRRGRPLTPLNQLLLEQPDDEGSSSGNSFGSYTPPGSADNAFLDVSDLLRHHQVLLNCIGCLLTCYPCSACSLDFLASLDPLLMGARCDLATHCGLWVQLVSHGSGPFNQFFGVKSRKAHSAPVDSGKCVTNGAQHKFKKHQVLSWPCLCSISARPSRPDGCMALAMRRLCH